MPTGSGNMNPNVNGGSSGAGQPSIAGTVNISDLIDYGKTFLGTPYKWGGSRPGGFDCSGFIQYVYGNMGIRLPRVSQDQARTGFAVSARDARPGDLVYYGSPAHHIGIYLGGGMMMAAPSTGDVVKVQKVYSGVSGYRRVVTDNGSAATGKYSAGGQLAGGQSADPNAAVNQYNYVRDLANSEPEIGSLLKKAIAGGWADSRFQSELQNTSWWRNHGKAYRDLALQKSGDPAEYQRKRDIAVGDIWNKLNNLGVAGSDALVGELLTPYLSEGWSDAELTRRVGNMVSVYGGSASGQGAVTVDYLKQHAADYLVPMNDGTLQQWTRQILSGAVPKESFDAYLVEQAKSMFPSLTAALDAGTTVKQFLQPYQSMAAQTLEVAPESVDWMNPTYRSQLFKADAAGKQTVASLTDYQLYLKNLPQFRQTKQANEQAATMTNSLLGEFGKVAA